MFEPGRECEKCHKRHVLEDVARACVESPSPSAHDRAATRRLVGQVGAQALWSRTEDRPAQTAAARQALQGKFLREAGGDEAKAEELRKAFYAELGRKGGGARRAKLRKSD